MSGMRTALKLTQKVKKDIEKCFKKVCRLMTVKTLYIPKQVNASEFPGLKETNMDSKKLLEIRNNIAALPVLREKSGNCTNAFVKPNARLKRCWRNTGKSVLMLSSLKPILSRLFC